MDGGVAQERRGPSVATLLRWSGMALVAAGLLMAVATALHPSQETTVAILANEARLVTSHVLFTLSYMLVLVGLPGLYGAESASMGRLGFAGFVVSFIGTTALAVSGNFGFLAPVLAAEAPETINAISGYPPAVALSALGAIGFLVGFVIFGMAVFKAATLPRLCGILIAVGAPVHLFGFALAQFASPALWPFTILGSVALGTGLAVPGYQMWQKSAS